MAEKEMKIRGYCFGQPIFQDTDPVVLTKEQQEEELLRDLDRVELFPNGKSYFVYANGEYFMAKDDKAEDSEADLTFLVKVNTNGDVISKRKFDVVAG